ncbi:MAG: polyprenyl synthetase family protein [Patescibacteria group bacterium]
MNIALLANLFELPGLPKYIQQVDQTLQNLPAPANPKLREATNRILNSHGKRLRPILVIAAAEGCGHQIDQPVIAAASAIELIHLASLVHDDIIDASDLRRGVPTVNGQEGVDTAILVGDYLLAMAGIQASKAGVDVARVVAEAFAAMCDGQGLELADNYNVDRSIDSYLDCIDKKTASLLVASVRIGGICAELPESKLSALGRYGEAFGMAFQLADDLNDLLSTTEQHGKPTGNDIKEGVYTMPLLLGLQGGEADELRGLLRHPITKANSSSIADILKKSGYVDQTIDEIDTYNKQAVTALNALEDGNNLAGLAALPNTYKNWALKP